MNESPSRSIAVVLASGASTRFRSDIPKQFLKLAGKTVLEHTLDTFERHPEMDEIVIVSASESRQMVEEIVTRGGYRKVTKIVPGGDTRQQSSASGIAAITGDDHKVLVHDAVRPLLDHGTIDRCLSALESSDAVDTAVPSSDTVIRVSDDHTITEIPDRAMLRLGQTPQGFRSGLLREAHRRASSDHQLRVTDDCGLILHYGMGTVRVVDGDINNIKITYPSDIYLADRIFQLRNRKLTAGRAAGDELRGKVIVVFGASRGIGLSITKIAAAHGAHVCGLSRQDGVSVADPLAVRGALMEARAKYGRVDSVINTAAILRVGLLAGQDYAAIDEQLSTNLRGSLVVAREAYDAMQGSGGSIILFTSSSYTRGRARYSVYSATKAAVVNLVQALAEEYLPSNVRINAINPERTATPMRSENFGVERAEQLLDPESVASATLAVCTSSATGEIVDVRH